MGGLFSAPSAGPAADPVAVDKEADIQGSEEMTDATLGALARPSAPVLTLDGPLTERLLATVDLGVLVIGGSARRPCVAKPPCPQFLCCCLTANPSPPRCACLPMHVHLESLLIPADHVWFELSLV